MDVRHGGAITARRRGAGKRTDTKRYLGGGGRVDWLGARHVRKRRSRVRPRACSPALYPSWTAGARSVCSTWTALSRIPDRWDTGGRTCPGNNDNRSGATEICGHLFSRVCRGVSRPRKKKKKTDVPRSQITCSVARTLRCRNRFYFSLSFIVYEQKRIRTQLARCTFRNKLFHRPYYSWTLIRLSDGCYAHICFPHFRLV